MLLLNVFYKKVFKSLRPLERKKLFAAQVLGFLSVCETDSNGSVQPSMAGVKSCNKKAEV